MKTKETFVGTQDQFSIIEFLNFLRPWLRRETVKAVDEAFENQPHGIVSDVIARVRAVDEVRADAMNTAWYRMADEAWSKFIAP